MRRTPMPFILLTLALLTACQTESAPPIEGPGRTEGTDAAATAAAPRDGTTRATPSGEFEAWDAGAHAWVTPEAFWLSYAQRNGGLTWGRRATLPPFGEVEERDLMLLEVESGVCLMEFWHRRWRRAQDVRRWSPEFNAYGGCPRVFD